MKVKEMKKLTQLLVAVAIVLFLTSQSWATWTITESRRTYKHQGSKTTIITLACISDGSAGAYDITTYMNDIKGLYFYSMAVTPGSGGVAPDNTFDIDVEDADDFHILDTNANSNTAKTWHLGLATLGQYPMVKDLISLVIADIGTAADEITIELFFGE